MNYRITVRYSGGQGRQRYHLEALRADGLVEALRALADRLPEEVAATGDLVEIRPDVDPEARSYLGEEARDREEALEDMGAGDGEEARASDEDQAGTEDQDKGDPSHG